MRAALDRKLAELPDQPGIYIFRSEAGEALYVGKAKSLRRRTASYRKPADDPRIALMLHDAADVEFVVTDSEAEALLLENNWIKRSQPRFNIRLRDDKTYPYLKLTLADGHPRLAFTRRIRRDGAEYYGPYLPAGLARKAIKLVQKQFGIRVCRIEIDGSLPRPCLYYDMKRCLGPCVDGLTTDEAYAESVERARLFLAGRNDELLRGLRGRMRAHADELEFEAAARVRDTIREIDQVSQRRKLSSDRGEDVDIFGAHISGDNAAVAVLVMRGGQVLDRRELFWEGVSGVTAERLLSELLPQLYDRTTLIPEGDPSTGSDRGRGSVDRMAERAARIEGLPAHAVTRREGAARRPRHPERGHGLPPAFSWRRRRGGGERGSATSPRVGGSSAPGSKASTSRPSAAARRSLPWWSGTTAGWSRTSTAASTSGGFRRPTTSLRSARRWSVATGAGSRKWGRCRI